MALTAAVGGIHPLLGLPFIPPSILDMVFGLDSQHQSVSSLFAGDEHPLCASLRFCWEEIMNLAQRQSQQWSLISLLLGPAAVVVMFGLDKEWPGTK